MIFLSETKFSKREFERIKGRLGDFYCWLWTQWGGRVGLLCCGGKS